jgi:hypothetical protein
MIAVRGAAKAPNRAATVRERSLISVSAGTFKVQSLPYGRGSVDWNIEAHGSASGYLRTFVGRVKIENAKCRQFRIVLHFLFCLLPFALFKIQEK